MTSRDSVNPDVEYRRVLRVLQGDRVPEDAPALAKMLKIIMSPELGTDVLISAAGFFVRYARWAKPSSYFANLAPPTVQALLRLGCVAEYAAAHAFRIDAEADAMLSGSEARWVWLRVGQDAVRIAIRPATNGSQPPLATAGLPEPLPFPVRRYATFDEEQRCPHCRSSATTWRYIAPALVCEACGRSFEPDDETLRRAQIAEMIR